MRHFNKILTVTAVVGSLGLAGLGIARAQAADTATTTSDADTAITTAATSTTTTTTTPPTEGKRHGQPLADMAAKFNMTEADLQKALDAGTPMYQIAAEHGVTYGTEQAQRLSDLKTRLDDMVKVKYMTQAEADAVYQAAQANPMLGMGMDMGRGGHGWMH
jgi:hypothetical protein